MALKERENQADIMVQEHHELTMEVLRCLRGIGEHGRTKISLFVDKAGEHGKADSSGV